MKLPSKEQIDKACQPKVWDFGNKVLYDMCKNYFKHRKDDQILAKVLFIGRIYAAAVERRRNKKNVINDFFYTDTIVPVFRNSELDDLLEILKEFKDLKAEIIQQVLQTHFYLTATLNRITSLEKRSFSSKYLHFHLPDLFFIYDSRAVSGLRSFTSEVPKDLKYLTQLDTVDNEYAKFFCKCFDLKRQIMNVYQTNLTNRQLDNLLIEIANKKTITK